MTETISQVSGQWDDIEYIKTLLKQEPLFIPLKTEHYEDFLSGKKTQDFKLCNNKWNKRECAIGRRVILSKGWNNKDCRLNGVITDFKIANGRTLSLEHQKTLHTIYGITDTNFAIITIKILK